MTLAVNLDQASVPIETIWAEIVDGVRRENLSEKQSYPWIIGFSGGKDSTVVVHALFEALLDVAPCRRLRPIHIVSNDTMVESPLVIAHLDGVTAKISDAAKSLGLPISVVRTKPDPDKTFWVLFIGKGYPSPNMTMRWCTDRLKIQPTSGYIKQKVSDSGAAIVVLGVRRDESQSRQRSIDKFQNRNGGQLTPHERLPGALIYRPIDNMAVDEIWEVLGTLHAPWGGDHTSFIKLYRDSEGGECPVVLSSDEAPGCGTSNSRFGCWTCTVVEKYKSLQGFVDAGRHQFKPLIDFRDWLKFIRNRPEMRQAIRRNGKLSFAADGKHIPGPSTIQARRDILARLLVVQDQFGDELITQDELMEVQRIWSEELQLQGAIADV